MSVHLEERSRAGDIGLKRPHAGRVRASAPRSARLPSDPAPLELLLPTVSVVVPVRDEADNVLPLAAEIVIALAPHARFEVIFVDDGSRDGTAERLRQARATHPEIRIIRHHESVGQSGALRSGVIAARGKIIVTLDGDGQNNPADILLLLAAFGSATEGSAAAIGLVTGHRIQRHDVLIRRLSSRVANAVRAKLLADATADTGCGLKVFARETFHRLPYFDHLHRFLPALVQREGLSVVSLPVHHRPRTNGRSKYGVRNRLWCGIVDLLGVMWLMRRRHRCSVDEEQ